MSAHPEPRPLVELGAPLSNVGCSKDAAARQSVGEIMAATGDPSAEASGTEFRFGSPVGGTDHPKDDWRPGVATTSGSRSLRLEGAYAEPVFRPSIEPFDRSGWPGLY